MNNDTQLPVSPAPTVIDSNDSKETKVSKVLSIISVILQALAGIFSRRN